MKSIFAKYQINSIHPRGKRYRSGIKRSSLKPDKSNFQTQLDYVIHSIDDLIADYDFDEEVNSKLFVLKLAHSSLPAKHTLEQVVSNTLEVLDILEDIKPLMQKLYREGQLKQEVKKEDLQAFIQASDSLVKHKEKFKKFAKSLKDISLQLKTLGLI